MFFLVTPKELDLLVLTKYLAKYLVLTKYVVGVTKSLLTSKSSGKALLRETHLKMKINTLI